MEDEVPLSSCTATNLKARSSEPTQDLCWISCLQYKTEKPSGQWPLGSTLHWWVCSQWDYGLWGAGANYEVHLWQKKKKIWVMIQGFRGALALSKCHRTSKPMLQRQSLALRLSFTDTQIRLMDAVLLARMQGGQRDRQGGVPLAMHEW